MSRQPCKSYLLKYCMKIKSYLLLVTLEVQNMCWASEDFKEGTLVSLNYPIDINGVAGTLYTIHVGEIKYELLNDVGGLTFLETKALYVPGLNCYLFSP